MAGNWKTVERFVTPAAALTSGGALIKPSPPTNEGELQ
jgi:hypothetical protein